MAVKSLAQSSLVEPFSTNSMLAGYSGNAFHHLETVRLSSTTTQVVFSSLEKYSDFQHLQLRVVSAGTTEASLHMHFNGDTGANYAWHGLNGYNGSVNSFAYTGASYPYIAYARHIASTTQFTASVVDILDPFDSAKNTTIRSLTGTPQGTPWVRLQSGLWINQSPIATMRLWLENGSYVAGSRFSLYGIKARA